MRRTDTMLEAIARGDLAAVDALLDAGVSVEGSARRRLFAGEEPTPLLAAVQAGSTKIVTRLLDRGADPNRETRKWMSPLSLACQRGDRSLAALLIARGADVNATGSRHARPLEAAAWYGHEALVAFLLERGADPDQVVSRGAGSLVRIRPSILRLLAAAGAKLPPEITGYLE